ncbi:MAG: hypothetical protein AAB919_03950 [Patescibacteria group bacterium]
MDENKKGIGPIAAAIIVVILLAIGGAYFFIQEKARFNTPPIEENLNA